ncbi:Vacuolar protein-sorting-associated protein 36 [Marasmius sp. AFHP31]|nr:Vacuolar protein-sorting-associated protein 36 [Marasmius sp. AFHP31]
MSSGTIGGIVGGVIALASILGIVIVVCMRRRARRNRELRRRRRTQNFTVTALPQIMMAGSGNLNYPGRRHGQVLLDIYPKFYGGITQILSQHQSSQSSTSASLSTALLNLEVLNIKAKEMVRVANDLLDRLATLKVDNDDTVSASSLTSSLNLAISKLTSLHVTPATQEMHESDKAFLASLSPELSSILVPTDTDPIIPLDCLWVKWTRARGISLIPPSTFLDIPPLLQGTLHCLRQLGDIKILYAPHFSTESVAARLPSPVTPTSFSLSKHISPPLAQLLLDEIKMLLYSLMCRDDWEIAIRPGGTVLEPAYYKNVFEEFT